MLGWVKAWLEMAVEEDDGKGVTRRTNRARRERKGTPQGSPISPMLSNLYMRRFILGWRVLGYARRFNAHIVNYADDFVVLGRAPSATMRAAVESLMKRLKLTVNVEKTRCCRVPEEPVEFLGYRIGRNYRRDTGRAYIGTRPSQASVQSIYRRISELTARQYGLLDPEVVVGRINRLMTGRANYFCLGQVRAIPILRCRSSTRRRHCITTYGCAASTVGSTAPATGGSSTQCSTSMRCRVLFRALSRGIPRGVRRFVP